MGIRRSDREQRTYSSVIDFAENSTALSASKNLVAGMITSPLTGAGLGADDTLRFRIVRRGTTLVDQTLTTNAAVQNYFNDTVFNLGVSSGNGAASLDVKYLFDLTVRIPARGSRAELLSGDHDQGGARVFGIMQQVEARQYRRIGRGIRCPMGRARPRYLAA